MNHPIDNSIVKLILKSIQEGDLQVIQLNIDKYKVNMNYIIDKDNQQNSFFYCSLIKDDNDALNVCKYLREKGVNPFFKDKHQQTCLYYTAREGKYLTSKYLIEDCGLPINEKDIYGQNPIYYSVREGKMNLCELFVEKGADINLEDKFGQTCIFYAIRTGHYDIVNFLIKNGANINKIDIINELLKNSPKILNFNETLKICKFIAFSNYLIKEIISYANNLKDTIELKYRAENLLDIVMEKIDKMKKKSILKSNKKNSCK